MDELINSKDYDKIKSMTNKIICGELLIPTENHSKVFSWACRHGHLQIAKLLIATPEFDSLNTPDNYNNTPFILACYAGNLEIVKLLISTPGFNSLNTPDFFKKTPFLWACRNGHLEIVKLLISPPLRESTEERGSDDERDSPPEFNSLNTQDGNKRTPFLWACIKGHLEIVELLISTPGFNSLNTGDIDDKTPFLWACRNGHLEIVKLLISTPGFNSLNTLDDRERNPFFFACFNGHLEIITILLLQENLIRPIDMSNFSEEVKNKISEVETNRTFYMKKYKTSLIIDIYRFVVFLSDYYLEVKGENTSSKFFKIIKKLPQELQIKTIFLTIKWNQTYILSEDFNDGLKEFVKKIENS